MRAPTQLSPDTGAGAFVNLNFELFKGFRVLTNNYWSDGGGRYIFGQVPDLIVRSNGSISPIKTGSTVSGFEFTHKNTMLYAYYGGIYVEKNATVDANGTTVIGYGYYGAATSLNRTARCRKKPSASTKRSGGTESTAP